MCQLTINYSQNGSPYLIDFMQGGAVVKTIFVDGARTLKRMRPAPQGRGYRVRKRSNHVTVIVDTKVGA